MPKPSAAKVKKEKGTTPSKKKSDKASKDGKGGKRKKKKEHAKGESRSPAVHASRTASALKDKLSGLLKKGDGSAKSSSDASAPAEAKAPSRATSPTPPPPDTIDDKDERIRQLEAQLALAQQPPKDKELPKDAVCYQPEGEAGRSGEGARKGYNLQEAMKLGSNGRFYHKILRAVRAGIDTFKFDTDIPFKKQDKRKINAMYPLLTEQFSYINPQRFPNLWIVEVLAHYCFANKRSDELKKKRDEASGKLVVSKKKVRRTASQRASASESHSDEQSDPVDPNPSRSGSAAPPGKRDEGSDAASDDEDSAAASDDEDSSEGSGKSSGSESSDEDGSGSEESDDEGDDPNNKAGKLAQLMEKHPEIARGPQGVFSILPDICELIHHQTHLTSASVPSQPMMKMMKT
ncbi:hypothetical protein DFP72DRAFT_1043835 [Ephemerocybe angulata]|uniref:Uncharacterized protein n=1 Tax=Ephemerocybe angulata TaxID=980116 RepID=A0A8H6I5J4_9AGAR|nr:hypothetical protein DFP72DRAFT_1043835 [Tulosesus angulatus]